MCVWGGSRLGVDPLDGLGDGLHDARHLPEGMERRSGLGGRAEQGWVGERVGERVGGGGADQRWGKGGGDVQSNSSGACRARWGGVRQKREEDEGCVLRLTKKRLFGPGGWGRG